MLVRRVDRLKQYWELVVAVAQLVSFELHRIESWVLRVLSHIGLANLQKVVVIILGGPVNLDLRIAAGHAQACLVRGQILCTKSQSNVKVVLSQILSSDDYLPSLLVR